MKSNRFLVATAISCVGILSGFDVGTWNYIYIMESFTRYFSTSSSNGEISSYLTLSSVIGAIIGYVIVLILGDKIGRQRTMFIGSCIFIIGSIVKCISPRNYLIFISGYFINELALGCLAVITPIFIAEIAPHKTRGRYIFYYFILAFLGNVLGNITGSILSHYEKIGRFAPNSNLGWKLAIIIEIIMAIIVTIIVFFIPKSPRWLCANKKDEQAVEVISKLHNSTALDSEVQEEFNSIKDEAAFNRSSSFGGLFSSLVGRRTFIVILMCVFQEIIGVNEVYYVLAQMKDEIGFKDIIYKLLIYVSTFLGLMIGIFFIDKVGRKLSLVIGSCLMMIILFITFIFAVKHDESSQNVILAILGCFLYAICYHFSWCYIPVIYATEVFPYRVRVKGVALSFILGAIFSCVISLISNTLVINFGTKILLVYGGICLVVTIISKLFFIESKNIKLEDMDNDFSLK